MKRIRSKPGLDQSEALISLQRMAHKREAMITSFVRQGDRWVASLRPLADFPPDDDDDSPKPPLDGPDDDGPDSDSDGPDDDPIDEGSDGPPIGSDDDDSKKKNQDKDNSKPKHDHPEEKSDHEILDILHKLVDGLTDAGIIKDDAPGLPLGDGPDGPPAEHGPAEMPPPPPGPSPAPSSGGPAGAPSNKPTPGPKGQPYGTKLKPGEIPNKPGMVPVGSPSFASAQHTADSLYTYSPSPSTPNGNIPASPAETNAVSPSGQPGAVVNPPCSKCGGPTEGGICPTCAQPAGGTEDNPKGGILASTFEIESSVAISVKDAYKELKEAYSRYGYNQFYVEPREDGTIAARVSVKPESR